MDSTSTLKKHSVNSSFTLVVKKKAMVCYVFLTHMIHIMLNVMPNSVAESHVFPENPH